MNQVMHTKVDRPHLKSCPRTKTGEPRVLGFPVAAVMNCDTEVTLVLSQPNKQKGRTGEEKVTYPDNTAAPTILQSM